MMIQPQNQGLGSLFDVAVVDQVTFSWIHVTFDDDIKTK